MERTRLRLSAYQMRIGSFSRPIAGAIAACIWSEDWGVASNPAIAHPAPPYRPVGDVLTGVVKLGLAPGLKSTLLLRQH